MAADNRSTAKRLRALLAQPLGSREDLNEWVRRTRVLKDEAWDLALSDQDAHFLIHYIDDADIRQRDAAYAAFQNGRLLRIIEALEKA